MSENEILIRGIVTGMAIVIPFLGITIAKWHSWKGWCKFWKMMHEDSEAQNERLFRALKSEEDRAKYFESKLKFVIEQYKPIGPIKKPTDNNKNNAIELLKPRIMENGCEYYLAGEVRLCIEKAARQIQESNSVYKELDKLLLNQKRKRCLAMADMCGEALCYWDNVKNTYFKGEAYCFRKLNHYGKWGQIWLVLSEKFKPNH